MGERYNKFFFESFCGQDYSDDAMWSAHFSEIAERIIAYFSPKTVLDAGCARGYLVAELRKRGVEAYGVDISTYAIESAPSEIAPYLCVQSLTDPLPKHFPQKFDLVVSLEVLEHMFPEDGKQAINNLCSYTDTILFSSTPYDLENTTHVNVQQAEYWAKEFAERSFFKDAVQSVEFAAPWAMLLRKRNDIPSVIFDYEIADRVLKMQMQKGAERKGSIFFDYGNGFTPDAKSDFTYYGYEVISGRIAIPAGCKGIRIDPVEGLFCTLSNPTIVTNCGLETQISFNAAFVSGEHYYFETIDPQFLVRFDDRAENNVCWVEFSGHISLCSEMRDVNAIAALLEKIEDTNQKLEQAEKQCEFAKAENKKLGLHYNAAIEQRDALQNEVAELRLMYAIISESASWKLTKPLRVILDLFKKVFHSLSFFF